MASALNKRLEKIEEALANVLSRPLAWFWLGMDEDADVVLDKLIADGELAAKDRGRIRFIRWWRDGEATEACRGGRQLVSRDGVDLPAAGAETPVAAQVLAEIAERPVAERPVLETQSEYEATLRREDRRFLDEKLETHYDRLARSIT